MLAQYQKNRLESIQKKCLKTIYGAYKTYEELLEEAEIQTLEERRTKQIGKFAIKAAEKILSLNIGSWKIKIEAVKDQVMSTRNYMQEVIDCTTARSTQWEEC